MLARMKKESKDPWPLIDQLAEEMGVSAEARRKWQYRGVPHRWRMPLMAAAKAKHRKIDPNAFDKPPRAEAA